MNAIEAKIAGIGIATLKDMALRLFNDTRDGSEIVFSAVLSALEQRLPEAEFVQFCEQM